MRPFELTPGGTAAETTGDPRVDASEFWIRLAELREAAEDKPLLAPHEDSRSRDLLDAVALIEEFWPGRRQAAVEPVLARR